MACFIYLVLILCQVLVIVPLMAIVYVTRSLDSLLTIALNAVCDWHVDMEEKYLL